MSIQDIARPGTERRTRADSLRGLCGGAVHLPGDPGYDEARMAWNRRSRPAAGRGRLPGNGGGDSGAGPGRGSGRAARRAAEHRAQRRPARQARRRGDRPDVGDDARRAWTRSGRCARVGGGALWLPVVEAAAAQGFATLHGSSPDVGVAGYSLGGGMGWYARETRPADEQHHRPRGGHRGRLRSCGRTPNENPELFWALRGGGGSFGIVTALEFGIFPFQSAFGGMLVWDRTETERVLRRWVDWTGDAPDEVTTSFRVLNLPPMPDIPEPSAGRQLVVIDGAVLASDERSTGILAALRELQPRAGHLRRSAAASLVRLHMDPEGPTPSVSNTALLDGMPEAAIDTFVGLAGPDSHVLAVDERVPPARRRARPAAPRRRCTADGGRRVPRLRRCGWPTTPEMAAAGQRDADRLRRCARAVRVGAPVPELRRAPDRPERSATTR